MTLHALDATANGAAQLQIHSPNTHVVLLAPRCYPELCENTLFVKGRGQHHRMIQLKPIVQTLGPEKIPASHALSGAVNHPFSLGSATVKTCGLNKFKSLL